MINEEQAKKYCSQNVSLIENYELAIADKTQTWDIHHRAEILPCGIYTPEQLKKHGLYYNVPVSQLIFLTHGEHMRIHKLGKKLSDEHRANLRAAMNRPETRAKISAAVSGENNPMFGKIGKNSPMFGKHHSEETRQKISAKMHAAMNKPETRAKISAASKGKRLSEECREKMRAAKKGAHWFNNGVECRFCRECPSGWQRGRLINKQSQ